MFGLVRVVLFERFVAQSGPHLKDEVSEVSEAELVFQVSELQKETWLSESLRLQKAILCLQQYAVTVLQDDIYVYSTFFVHLFAGFYSNIQLNQS